MTIYNEAIYNKAIYNKAIYDNAIYITKLRYEIPVPWPILQYYKFTLLKPQISISHNRNQNARLCSFETMHWNLLHYDAQRLPSNNVVSMKRPFEVNVVCLQQLWISVGDFA